MASITIASVTIPACKRALRSLLVIFSILLVPLATAFASVSYTLITASQIQDVGANALQNGNITFAPVDASGSPLASRGIMARSVVCLVVAGAITTQQNGFSACQVADALAANPTLCYKIALYDTVKQSQIPTPGQSCVQPTGSTWSYDAYTPINASVPLQVVAGSGLSGLTADGAGGINVAGNVTAAGAFSGAGTGLTGTAPAFSIGGNAATATSATDATARSAAAAAQSTANTGVANAATAATAAAAAQATANAGVTNAAAAQTTANTGVANAATAATAAAAAQATANAALPANGLTSTTGGNVTGAGAATFGTATAAQHCIGTSCISVWPPSAQLPHWTAKLQAVKTGGTPTVAQVCMIGPSTTYGAHCDALDLNDPLCSVGGQAAYTFNTNYGVPATWDSFFGDAAAGSGGTPPTVPQYGNSDSRITLGSWAQNTTYISLGHYTFSATSSASPLTFSPIVQLGTPSQVDTFQILYPIAPGLGSFSANIDGGTPTVVSQTGANAAGMVTLTASAGVGTHTLNISEASGTADIDGARAYDSTTSHVVFNLAGSGSENSQQAADTSTAYGAGQSAIYSALGCDVTVIDMTLGMNNAYQGNETAHPTQASIQALINAAQTAGSDVVLLSPVRFNPSSFPPATDQTPFYAIAKALAAANTNANANGAPLPLVDDYSQVISYAWGEVQPVPYYSSVDNLHPSAFLNGIIATDLQAVLAAVPGTGYDNVVGNTGNSSGATSLALPYEKCTASCTLSTSYSVYHLDTAGITATLPTMATKPFGFVVVANVSDGTTYLALGPGTVGLEMPGGCNTYGGCSSPLAAGAKTILWYGGASGNYWTDEGDIPSLALLASIGTASLLDLPHTSVSGNYSPVATDAVILETTGGSTFTLNTMAQNQLVYVLNENAGTMTLIAGTGVTFYNMTSGLQLQAGQGIWLYASGVTPAWINLGISPSVAQLAAIPSTSQETTLAAVNAGGTVGTSWGVGVGGVLGYYGALQNIPHTVISGSYTVLSTDALVIENGSSGTLTLNAMSANQLVGVLNNGAGSLTAAPGTGVTFLNMPASNIFSANQFTWLYYSTYSASWINLGLIPSVAQVAAIPTAAQTAELANITAGSTPSTFWGLNSSGVHGFYAPTGSGTVNYCASAGYVAIYNTAGTAISCVNSLTQNTTGTAANVTGTNNSTLTTLSSLSLPVGQITGLGTGATATIANYCPLAGCAMTGALTDTTASAFASTLAVGTSTFNAYGDAASLDILGDIIASNSTGANTNSISRFLGVAYSGHAQTLIAATSSSTTNVVDLCGGTQYGEPCTALDIYMGPVGTKAAGTLVAQFASTGLAMSAESISGASSYSGNGTASFAAGTTATAGTSPGTPVCTTSHVCDSFSGIMSFTTGTGTSAAGVLLTITLPTTRTNLPNCSGRVYLAASPYTELPSRLTYTTSTIVFNVGTTPAASTAYELVYAGCGGN